MPDPESKPANDVPIFTVDSLLKYMGNDQKAFTVVAKIIRDAIAAGAELLDRAGAAVRAGRYTEAAHAFHGLRGSVGTLGTRRFVSAALDAELAIVENRPDDVPALLANLETEFAMVLEHAHAWLAQHDVHS
jgi:HPt (histidine-containing phosphotransfer) domain-containing protein